MVLLFASFASVFAQTKVSGTVTDASGTTVPGVSIVEKGTPNGITSDINGKYSLTVGSNAILHFVRMLVHLNLEVEPM